MIQSAVMGTKKLNETSVVRRISTLTAAGLIATSGLLIGTAAPAEASSTKTFIRKAVPAAQATQRAFGVPASITIAQAILESGWGRSELTRTANNYFGVKCTPKASPYQSGCLVRHTTEYYGQRKVVEQHRFRTYRSAEGSFKDHAVLLTTVFKPAMVYKNNPDAFIRRVHQGGYATDPNYSNLIIQLMRQYNLYQYDLKPAPAKKPATTKAPTKAKTATKSTTKKSTPVTRTAAGPTMTTSRIRAVQALLQRQGYKVPVTGTMNTTTINALKSFQRAQRLPVTGKVDQNTLSKLYFQTVAPANGPQVSAVQSLLKMRGYPVDKTMVYGPVTIASVKKFQARSGLRADGVVGTSTWVKLFA